MTQLYRAMREVQEEKPEVAPTSRALGARPGIDVPAVAADDLIRPGEGGASVSPDDPLNLPSFRRPPEFKGTGRDPVWSLSLADLGPDLTYRPDPTNPGHGFLEPARPMTFAEYQRALAQTCDLWRKVEAPTEEETADEA